MTIPVVVQMTVDSGTTYDLSADTNLQEIDLDNELEINVVSYDVPEYQGSYTVDAGLSPVVLNTQDKRLTQNVTVNALTENSVSMTDFTVAANSGVAAITSTVTSGYSATAKSSTTTVQLPTQSGTTITPTTSEQTAVAKGKYTTGVVKVGAIPSQYADITGVTANASDVLAGKYFVNNLGELTLGTGTGGGGLDTETKDALLECFEHVAWADSDGQIYYNNLLNALYPLQSISAVYTQSGDVYADTPLDDLKADLVVTATFEDGTTKTVTNYTLSGTLAVGTSTVTVTYFTETTTFNVTVSSSTVIVDGTTLGWVRGYINASGNVQIDNRATGGYTSDYCDLHNKASFLIALSGSTVRRMAFYDSEKSFISRVLAESGTIPSNAKYGRVSIIKSSLGNNGYDGTGTTITLNP